MRAAPSTIDRLGSKLAVRRLGRSLWGLEKAVALTWQQKSSGTPVAMNLGHQQPRSSA
ncbi:hypothetical protein BH09PSE5_BH09PSE5_37730 [soil metagenome]